MRRRRSTLSYAVPAQQPIRDLNTTPLIDVMLVLLIMFIVTIPISTHKVAVDLPQGDTRPLTEPTIHRLALDASGRLSWDGAALTEAGLPARLAAMQREDNPQLHLRADGNARYEDYDRVLATIKRAGVEKLGLVGNEGFAL